MRSPYEGLPPQAFWRSAVVERQAEAVAALHRPRFDLDAKTPLMTAGSCFAQHLHRTLKGIGWTVMDEEDAGGVLHPKVAARFGYGQYSARYGNIYTARQFHELVAEALGADLPTLIWERDGRYVDALRPAVEPEGLGSEDEVRVARADHLRAVRRLIEGAGCVIFTLGLTECWLDEGSGRALPVAPGTMTGDMATNPARFVNFSVAEVRADMEAARDLIRQVNPGARFLLTVSPVPLTATASGSHVALASTASKAVLRAACAELVRAHDDIDYFPSYEIITTPMLGGPFFAPNLRSPSEQGVARVMEAFVSAYGGEDVPEVAPAEAGLGDDADVICEEILLEAFAK